MFTDTAFITPPTHLKGTFTHLSLSACVWRKVWPSNNVKSAKLRMWAFFQQVALQNRGFKVGCDYDLVFNCAGLNGGKISGDDDTVTPSRGIAIEVRLKYSRWRSFIFIQVEAPWQKHFNYRNFDTFTIPKWELYCTYFASLGWSSLVKTFQLP